MVVYAVSKYESYVRVMVFDAMFYTSSVIWWRSVLLLEGTGVPSESRKSLTKHYHIMYRVPLVMSGIRSHWQTLSNNV